MRKIHRGGTLVREYEYDLGAYKTGMRRTDRLADGTMRVREIVADRYGNPVRIMDGAGQTLITYTYNDKRQLVKVRDETTERETAFTYNAYTGEVTSVTEDGVTVAEKFDYGKRLASRTQWEDNKTEEYGYTYDDALKNRLTKITKNGGEWKTFSYDGFDRMTEERTALDGDGAYEKVTAYRADGTINRTEHTTPLYAYEESYGFDQSGNITGIYTDRGDVRYTYDAYGRLITEENERLGKTWKYGYDSRGNITYKEETDSGTGSGERRVYEYEPYTDRLKRIRKYRETGYYTGPSVLNRGAAGAGTPGGKTSMETWYLGGFAGLSLTPGPEWYQYGEEEYGTDSAGNALQFRSNVVEWDNRRLKKYGDVNYTYDGYGKRRSKKKEGEEEHTYEWLGEELKTERYGTHTLRYEYGVNGVTEIELDGERYIYVRNGQGDVVGILDGSGRLTAEYLYDAWGNHEVKCYDAEGEPVTDEAAIRNT